MCILEDLLKFNLHILVQWCDEQLPSVTVHNHVFVLAVLDNNNMCTHDRACTDLVLVIHH